MSGDIAARRNDWKNKSKRALWVSTVIAYLLNPFYFKVNLMDFFGGKINKMISID